MHSLPVPGPMDNRSAIQWCTCSPPSGGISGTTPTTHSPGQPGDFHRNKMKQPLCSCTGRAGMTTASTNKNCSWPCCTMMVQDAHAIRYHTQSPGNAPGRCDTQRGTHRRALSFPNHLALVPFKGCWRQHKPTKWARALAAFPMTQHPPLQCSISRWCLHHILR